jgi:hypothetical protein
MSLRRARIARLDERCDQSLGILPAARRRLAGNSCHRARERPPLG